MEAGGKDVEEAKLSLLKMRELIHGWSGAFSESTTSSRYLENIGAHSNS